VPTLRGVPRAGSGRLGVVKVVLRALPWLLVVALLTGCGGLPAATGPRADARPSPTASGVCTDTYVLCDDFDGPRIDGRTWNRPNTEIANEYAVRRRNVRLTTVSDQDGASLGVVDARIIGDRRPDTPRQGGVLVTDARLGAGRYEVRMKPLPGPFGCSCIWNYYDSLNEAEPPPRRVYTEIDIEMPAHLSSPPPWPRWRRTLGLNTWSRSDADRDATYLDPVSDINPFDGAFHVFRFDWHTGTDGRRRIDWYVDDVLQASTTRHVSRAPARVWIGVWPAPWEGLRYDFDSAHLYIDWVKVTAL
jgi:Glycosyl hydrolases family 16